MDARQQVGTAAVLIGVIEEAGVRVVGLQWDPWSSPRIQLLSREDFDLVGERWGTLASVTTAGNCDSPLNFREISIQGHLAIVYAPARKRGEG